MVEIQKLVVKVERDPKKHDYFTPEDEAKFAELIKEDGALALYIYSRNVLTKDGIVRFDEGDRSVRTIAKSGEMYVPVSLFTDFLGVKEPFDKDGDYLHLEKTCKVLGISVAFYNDDMLAVINGSKIHEQIKLNPRLVYAGGYAVFGKYDTSKFTAADYAAMREKWRVYLAGSPEFNDLSDPVMKKKIGEIDKKCEETLAGYHRDMDAPVLFGDELPTASRHLMLQYYAVYSLALAWATYGSKYYQKKEILDDVLFGLEWMYRHMYGEAEIEDRGWRSAHDYDWWHWFVGAVEPLNNTMMLVCDYLTKEQIQTYYRCFRWVISFMRQGYIQSSAASRIRVCTQAAMVLEDSDMLEIEYNDFDLMCEINEDGEGPHIDYIHWTHHYPYNLVYGHTTLERALDIAALLGGTPFEFASPKQYNLFKLAKYTFEPILYRGRGAVIFAGRLGARTTEQTQGIATLFYLFPMIGLFGEDEDRYLKCLIKRNSIEPEIMERVKNALRPKDRKTYLEIIADQTIPYDNGYEIGHAYFTGDRAVQQRNDYAFVVAMASTRHPSYESINAANKMGWYTGDGAVYLYTNNDAHTYACENFTANEKVMMNVPGTTVDTQKRIHWSYHPGPHGYSDFVGCMDTDEKYVTAAMDYEAYHFDGEMPDNDNDYGGKFVPHKNDLKCKKAYFLLDRECVCLGAGITSTTGFPVKTVVENRRLLKDSDGKIGIDKTTLGGEVLSPLDFDITVQNPKYAYLEGTAGYVFLDGANIGAEKYTETYQTPYPGGADGGYTRVDYEKPKRFFKLTVEHGINPTKQTYAYVTLPYASELDTAAYAKCPEVEIIANTEQCQAIRKKSIGFTSYIFYKAGACEEISVSEPCIVTVRDKGGEREISVCDPTMKLEKIEINVNKSLRFVKADNKVKYSDGVISVDMTRSVGRPFHATFEI